MTEWINQSNESTSTLSNTLENNTMIPLPTSLFHSYDQLIQSFYPHLTIPAHTCTTEQNASLSLL